MPEIMTVSGPIAPDNLGFTSMHEHVLYDGRVFRRRFEKMLPGRAGNSANESLSLANLGQIKHGFIMCPETLVMEDEDIMADELADFKSQGGFAVVDMSTPGLRVDPLKTRRVSEKSGVHIIATTGLYSLDSWPGRFLNMTSGEMESAMMREVEEGMGIAGVRPGHVKVAVEGDFPEQEIASLRAGARVARRTGLSMTVHQGMLLSPDAGERIAEIILEEKLEPGRVVIAHNERNFVEHHLEKLINDPNGWKLNLSHAKCLLERGFNISIDCFGHYWDAEILGICAIPDWLRLAGLVSLIRQGYARQIVIGTDTFMKILLRRFGGEGYCRLTSFVIPSLQAVGVASDDIRRITIENPARILASQKK